MRSIYEAVCPNMSRWVAPEDKGPAGVKKKTKRKTRRGAMFSCPRDKKVAMGHRRDIRRQEQPAIGHGREGVEKALDVGSVLDGGRYKLDRERGRRNVCGAQEVVIDGALGVGHQRSASEDRRDLLEQGH